MWIRSPYTPDYFKEFAPIANELENIRVNEEGTIDIQYMADIGDETLFLGARPLRLGGGMANPPETAEAVRPLVRESEGLSPSLVPTGSPTIARVHATRVEMTPDGREDDLAYIRGDARITDVVVVAEDDVPGALLRIGALVRALDAIPHVNAVRLRSRAYNEAPRRFTPTVIDTLGGLNKLTVVNPQRLEIEVQFLEADEIEPIHARLTRQLNNRGITVYNNTPLLGRINDTPDAIHRLAYACREAGIEFHHLYVAGLPIQNRWNKTNPVALYDVVDIATRVRREGSGREVPRYIIRTILGEVDFGLSATFAGEEDRLSLKLLPYDLVYFKALWPDFNWPEGVREAEDGRPVVPLAGLKKTTDFAFS
jgi:hypothetical protein